MFCCRPRTDYVVAASSSQSLLTHSRTLSPKNSFHVARHPVNQSQRRGLAIMEITIRKPFRERARVRVPSHSCMVFPEIISVAVMVKVSEKLPLCLYAKCSACNRLRGGVRQNWDTYIYQTQIAEGSNQARLIFTYRLKAGGCFFGY